MALDDFIAKILVYGVPILGLVAILAGIIVFIAAPEMGQEGRISMITWGVGFLLVLQGLTSIFVGINSLSE
ncbi:hypothetical protein [Halorubellus salinus]|uniref:hypothetical protein n=1 Tax=Halorubellus salinus TaxID=755309 RepID=UPI001D07DC65|nr:hypothetical protein [Halorubellus salinus]